LVQKLNANINVNLFKNILKIPLPHHHGNYIQNENTPVEEVPIRRRSMRAIVSDVSVDVTGIIIYIFYILLFTDL